MMKVLSESAALVMSAAAADTAEAVLKATISEVTARSSVGVGGGGPRASMAARSKNTDGGMGSADAIQEKARLTSKAEKSIRSENQNLSRRELEGLGLSAGSLLWGVMMPGQDDRYVIYSIFEAQQTDVTPHRLPVADLRSASGRAADQKLSIGNWQT
jgi:hypothetical protein